MVHVTCELANAEGHVLVLRAVKLARGWLQGVKNGLSNGEQVADVILAAEHFWVPVGLEVGFNVRGAAELVLVTVKQVGLWVTVDSLHVAVQQVGLNGVVVVHEGNKVALCGLDAKVRVFRNAEVLLQGDHRHAFVSGGKLADGCRQSSFFGGGVYQDKLQLAVGLAQDRGGHVVQEAQGRLVERYHERERGLNGEASDALAGKLLARGAMRAEPVVVGGVAHGGAGHDGKVVLAVA